MSDRPPASLDPQGPRLAASLAPWFDAVVRARGERYQTQGRVALSHLDEFEVYAAVFGTSASRYEVSLEWEDGDPVDIVATCTCPHYERGNLCKHVWAAVLEVDGEGWPEEVAGASNVQILHEMEVEPPEEDDFEALMQRIKSAPWSREGTRPAGPSRGPGRSGPSDWRHLVRSAGTSPGGAPAMAAGAEREAWFLVNAEASRRQGGLVVDYHHRQRLKDGRFGKLRREGLSEPDIDRYPDPEDRRLLALLLGNRPADGGYADSFGGPPRHAGCRVVPIMHDLVLPALAATGRLGWPEIAPDEDRDGDAPAEAALLWDGDASYRLRLTFDADDSAGSWTLGGRLERDGEPLELDAVRLALPDGLLLFEDRIGRLARLEDYGWLAALRRRAQYPVPYDDRARFLVDWWSAPYRPAAALPPALAVEATPGQPVGHLAISTKDAQIHGTRVRFRYESTLVDPDDPSGAVVDVESARAVVRDRKAERALLDRAQSLGLTPGTGPLAEPGLFRVAARSLAELTRTLLADGWTLESDGRLLRSAGELDLTVTSDLDWFDLDARVDFDGVGVSLPALLAAAAQGHQHLELDDGSRALLPSDLLERYQTLAELGRIDGDRIRFGTEQALIVDALIEAESCEARVDERFQRWRDRLRGFEHARPATEPPTFTGALRGYQREGLGWMLALESLELGGCLADDMGLGKTVQVLALLDGRVERRAGPREPSLVVVTRSLVFNWCAEARRFAPRLRVLDYTGPNRESLRERFDGHDVIVTTYGTLRRDAVVLSQRRFDYVILDEAQAIKNASAQVAKAARVLDARHRLAMTGTPVENHLGELWSLFEFLNPGLLGRSAEFERLASSRDIEASGALDVLATGVRPFVLRRTKGEVLTDLPEKTESTLYCELGSRQRAHYDELRAHYRAALGAKIESGGLGRAKIQVLEALLRLRQAACHPGLVDRERTDESSAKLEVIVEQLRDVAAEGHKALVFSQFTRFLALVRAELDREGITYEYLDGRTRDRQRRVERFQSDPDCPAFLISLKAGGHGLNLTAADYVFILDPWWNPAVEAQAIDRAHRIGQSRPVFAYRLIAHDTVEEKILTLQARKRELAEAIITADQSLMKSLTADDLRVLLG